MKIVTETTASATKLVADLAPLKWLAAVGMAAVEYVLPSTATREAAIGAGLLIAVDTATGFLVAWRGGAVQSSKMRRVVEKFLGYAAILVMTSVVTKNVVGMQQLAEVGTTGVLTLVIVTEAVSIAENCLKLGLKLPFGLAEALKKRIGQTEAEKPKGAGE